MKNRAYFKFDEKYENLVGRVYGRLTVKSFLGWANTYGRNRPYALCVCSCGTEKELQIISTGGKMFAVMSCGCLTADVNGARVRKHGGCTDRLYINWNGMKGRCYNKNNPSYHNYGGRGITVCDEWFSYDMFRAWALSHGYEDGLTIERINVNGHYCPANCTWITKSRQQDNKRNTRWLTVNGVTKTVTAWARELGLCKKTIVCRLNRGVATEKVFSKGRLHTDL